MNVLAIGAHGDDLEAFCGGTLALYAQSGHHVVMCVVTDGSGRPMGDPQEIAQIRKAEAQASADLIGAGLAWLAIPDGELTVDEATRFKFVEVIRSVAADVIITHPPGDYHPDHNATNQLVMDASQTARTSNYRSSLPPIRKPLPVAFMDAEFGINFVPEDYVDISDVWNVKAEMFLKHKSQHMPGPKYDPDFVLPPTDTNAIVRAARVISEFRGLACSVAYPEACRCLRAANRIVPH